MVDKKLAGLRFFLAGKGLSFRTGQYFGEAMLVGALAGLVVVGFRYMIDFGREWIMEGIGGYLNVVSLAGGPFFASSFSV